MLSVCVECLRWMCSCVEFVRVVVVLTLRVSAVCMRVLCVYSPYVLNVRICVRVVSVHLV